MFEDPAPWIELFGRLHIVVLHLPIGLIAGLVLIELAFTLRWKAAPREIVSLLAWCTAVSAVIAAGSGYVLSLDGPESLTLTRHLQFGIALAVTCVLMAAAASKYQSAAPYRLLLLAGVGLLLPTGHLGASMTHGRTFLTQPLARILTPPAATTQPAATQPATTQPAVAPPVATADSSPQPAPSPITDAATEVAFETHVRPVLAEFCFGCHGQTRQRGGLALHEPDAITRGGDSGALLVAGRPAESELIRRLRLPLDADEHMPPAARPQPTADQIAALERWIEAGATWGAHAFAAVAPDVAVAAEHSDVVPAQPVQEPAVAVVAADNGVPPPDPAALEALRAHFVHIGAVAQDSHLVEVSFAAVAPTTDDATATRLLEPLLPQLDTLTLSRCAVGDTTAALLANAGRLRRLDLGGTAVTNAGVAAIARLASLEELVLSRTRLTPAAVEHLAGMPGLRRVFVWKSGLSDEAVARLRERRPELAVDTGVLADAVVQEVEPDPVLTSDAPLPGEPPPAAPTAPLAAVSPVPINTTCPVSGAPVDPRYLILHEKRVIGFCCPNCPKPFWDDPAKFADKLASLPGPPPAAASPAVATPPPAATPTPPPTAAPTPPPDGSLIAINTACPVSGTPIDPRYLLAHDNRVIGFCCPNCPKQFWADPTKFADKLPPTPASPPAMPLVATNTACPISGTPVDPRFLVVHANRVIGFCCPNCPDRFWADPDKFVAK